MFAGQVFLLKMAATVSTEVAITRKQFAIGQPRSHLEWIDAWHPPRTDNAIDADDGLFAGNGVVTTAKDRDLAARLPAHLPRRVMGHGLLQRNPRLWQTLRRQLQDFQNAPPVPVTPTHTRNANVRLSVPTMSWYLTRSQYTLFHRQIGSWRSHNVRSLLSKR